MSEELPEHIIEAANAAAECFVPKKSKSKYQQSYDAFCKWMKMNNVTILNEDVIVAYFYEKSKTFKSSTLWCTYSMLKATIKLNDNVDISKYTKLTAFLKRTNDNYIPKKAKTLTMTHVETFLREACDEDFLLMRVVLLFGLNGACRKVELCNLLTTDVIDAGTMAVITLRGTKNKTNRTFTVTSDCNGYNYYKQYVSLRPVNIKHNRFFITYKKGQCTPTPVGTHLFSKFTKQIAQFLKIPDFESYTGHCLRRTSCTLLADSGVDLQVIKRHGGWKSNTVAEGYIDSSLYNKMRTSNKIFEQASHNNTEIDKNQEEIQKESSHTFIPTNDVTDNITCTTLNNDIATNEKKKIEEELSNTVTTTAKVTDNINNSATLINDIATAGSLNISTITNSTIQIYNYHK